MFKRVLAVSTLVSCVAGLGFMQVTSPTSIHPVGILFMFLLLYVSVSGGLTFLVHIARLIYLRLASSSVDDRDIVRDYFYASIISLILVTFVGLRSIGRVELYEVILLMTFGVIAVFYVNRKYGK